MSPLDGKESTSRIYSLMGLGIFAGVALLVLALLLSSRVSHKYKWAQRKQDLHSREESIVQSAVHTASGIVETRDFEAEAQLIITKEFEQAAAELVEQLRHAGSPVERDRIRRARDTVAALERGANEFVDSAVRFSQERKRVQDASDAYAAILRSAFETVDQLYGNQRVERMQSDDNAAGMQPYRRAQIEILGLLPAIESVLRCESAPELIGIRENTVRPAIERARVSLERIAFQQPAQRDKLDDLCSQLQQVLGAAADRSTIAISEEGVDLFSKQLVVLSMKESHERSRRKLLALLADVQTELPETTSGTVEPDTFSAQEAGILIASALVLGLLFISDAVATHRHLARAQQELFERSENLRSLNSRLTEEIECREEAEVHLRQLSQAIEHCPVSVIITDVKGRIEYVNPHFTKLTGFTKEQAVGEMPNLLKSGKTPVSVYQDMWRTILAGKTWSGEILNRKRSGEFYWERAIIAPLRNESGEITHFVGVKEDITTRRLDKELRQKLTDELSEQNKKLDAEQRLLRTIVDSVPLALFWKDRESVYLGCNDAFAKMAGLSSPEAIRGLTDYDLPWSKEEADHYRQCDGEVMNDERALLNLEEPLTGPNGEQRILWTSKTPLWGEGERVIGMVGAFADVTENRRAERERARLLEELERRQALLEAIFDTAADAILVFDTQSNIVRANRSAEQVFAVQSGELIGQLLNRFIGNDSASTAMAKIHRAMKSAPGGVLFRNTNVRAVRSDNSAFEAELSVSKAFIQGDVIFTAILRDVSDRSRLEEQLSRAQKLESIGQLSAGIAHEINTPMQFLGDNIEFLNQCAGRLFTVVDLYRELLEGTTPVDWQERRAQVRRIANKCRFDHIREQFPKAIEDCREGIQRTVKIVKAMKDFSHPGNKTKTPIDINEAIESTVAISRNRWKYAAEMELQLDPNLPLLSAYAAEVNQVLLNLVINAADAIAERFADGHLGQITIRTQHTSDSILIEVEDNGTGIPDEIREKVFDPFFTTKEVGKGTGQGLAITHNVVVNLHGGTVDVQSEEGTGTVFSVRFPLEPFAPGADADGKVESAETAEALTTG